MKHVLAALGAASAVLLAGCSGAPGAAPSAPVTATTPASATADLALCREVDKASRELNTVLDNPDLPDDSLIPAVGAVMDLDDSQAVNATPALRDEVWALADTANDWLEAYHGSRFDDAQTELANALVAVGDACAVAGHPLQR